MRIKRRRKPNQMKTRILLRKQCVEENTAIIAVNELKKVLEKNDFHMKHFLGADPDDAIKRMKKFILEKEITCKDTVFKKYNGIVGHLDSEKFLVDGETYHYLESFNVLEKEVLVKNYVFYYKEEEFDEKLLKAVKAAYKLCVQECK